jgi:predicted phosphoribosyltransferase
VLAVPRGGVPLGYYIARNFNFPLEIILTKKIGHPYNPEYAIGAVSLDNEEIDYHPGVSREYIVQEIERIRASLKERYALFMGKRKPVDLNNRIVIIVDDGIATGHTVMAAIKMLRTKKPKKIVVAVPVAPKSTVGKIQKMADEVHCLHAPEEFWGVGQFYDDFSEVTDDEVIQMLKQANGLSEAA